MIRRAGRVRWMLLLSPAVTTWAGLPVPGPPSNELRDFWIAVAIFATGIVGLLVLRLIRSVRAESEMPPRFRSGGRAPQGDFDDVLHATDRSGLGRAADTHQYNAAGSGITFLERDAKVPTVLP